MATGMDSFENSLKLMSKEEISKIFNRLNEEIDEEAWKHIKDDESEEIQIKASLLVTKRYFEIYPTRKEDFDKISYDNYDDISEEKEDEGFDGDSLDNEIEGELLSLFYKKFPEEEKAIVKFNEEHFDKFCNNILQSGQYLRDNVWDEVCRNATDTVAEEFKVKRELIILINPRGV